MWIKAPADNGGCTYTGMYVPPKLAEFIKGFMMQQPVTKQPYFWLGADAERG